MDYRVRADLRFDLDLQVTDKVSGRSIGPDQREVEARMIARRIIEEVFKESFTRADCLDITLLSARPI